MVNFAAMLFKSIVKNAIVFVLLLIVVIFTVSCEKDCAAGSGGDVTLVLKPMHHNYEIFSSATYRDTAYIKFNATNFPGVDPSLYDIVAIGNSGENFVKVNNLKCGQYFIYMTGFDTSAVWNIRVVGGIPLNFTETEGEKLVVVPVTE
jgi:hypothetical protein